MSKTSKWIAVAIGAAVVGTTAVTSLGRARADEPESAEHRPACQGPNGMGRGAAHGMGRGAEHGMGPGGEHGGDMAGIHSLFAHRGSITRTVNEVPGGVQTVTESDEADVTTQIQDHVAAMYARLKEGRPIHARDPLFAALFRNADKIDVRIEKTIKGLRVTETSKDADVIKLIRKHAQVVSLFLANGMHEMMNTH